jgi:16S rRNA processing protein RimM
VSEVSYSEQLEKEITWLKVGNISGVFGVKGWLKIYANTDKKETYCLTNLGTLNVAKCASQ